METNQSGDHNYDHLEDLSIFWKAFCFLIPIVGMIIYFVERNKGEMLKAKSGLTAAIAGMILNVLLLLTQNYF